MKKVLLPIIMLVFVLTWSLPVMAVGLKEAQQQKSTIDSRISKLNSEKKKIQEEKAALEKNKKAVASVQAAKANEYNKLLSDIDELEANLREINQAVVDAEANYNQQQELLKTRLKVMYENSNSSVFDTLVQSKNLIDFLEKLQYISLISKNDKKVVGELDQAKQDVEFKKQMQEEAKQGLVDKASDKQEQLTTLKASRAELDQQIQRSQSELAKLEKQEDDLLKESDKLGGLIKSLSRKGKYTGGTMVWPAPGNYTVVSSYGMRRHPILKKYKMHTGIDIDADKGDSIVAANNGTVIVAKYDKGGYGNMIVIDHGGGITTLYGHASKLLVEAGDEVKAGQVIAKVGSTGLSTGPHLHFEVRKDGATKNPLNGYLSK